MTTIQRIRVPAGFLFAVAYLYFAQPTPLWWVLGGAVAGVGLSLRIWAAGHLVKWERLAVSGPYRYTRNPLYLGSFLMGLGFGIASARLEVAAAFVILFLVIYIPVMAKEEGELRQAYATEFEAYRERVPRFFPKIGPQSEPGAAEQGNFLWERAVSNREYQAVLGYLLGLAALAVKMIWL